MGIGNPDGGDDSLGVRLAERLLAAGVADVLIAGNRPEMLPASQLGENVEHVVFIDAVDFGAAAGSVVMLDSGQVQARYPQISTHRLSLGLLAKLAEANGRTRAWLLGVQPRSLRPGEKMSPEVSATLLILEKLLKRHLLAGVAA
jgi:hydrogenase 3 maturation protease